MEELKLLVDMVAHLPSMALWVLCGYLVYKLAVVGSIYGLIRFCIDRLHSWLMAPNTRTMTKIVQVEPRVRGICISRDGTFDDLLVELNRLRGKGTQISSDYIHDCSVRWLREAINDKEEAERRANVKAA